MDLTIRSASYGQEDQTWLASAHATDTGETITLNASLFTLGTHYPAGYLKSGIVLGKVTATGLYGPYNDALSNGQEVAVGILFTSIPLPATVDSTVKPQGVMLRHCMVIESKLVGIDTAGKTDLAGRVVFR